MMSPLVLQIIQEALESNDVEGLIGTWASNHVKNALVDASYLGLLQGLREAKKDGNIHVAPVWPQNPDSPWHVLDKTSTVIGAGPTDLAALEDAARRLGLLT